MFWRKATVPQGKFYRGRRVRWAPIMEMDGNPLLPRHGPRDEPRVVRTQPTWLVFFWGDASPRSVQLALARVADFG